jgi:hypothetical protein
VLLWPLSANRPSLAVPLLLKTDDDTLGRHVPHSVEVSPSTVDSPDVAMSPASEPDEAIRSPTSPGCKHRRTRAAHTSDLRGFMEELQQAK